MIVLEDRECVARELNDNTMQQPFSSGLTLLSMPTKHLGDDGQAKLTKVLQGYASIEWRAEELGG